MNNIILDTILGGLLIGSISYLSNIYGKNTEFYKILAFIWAVPLTFFFFINMASRDGKKAIKDFSRHSIIGLVLTIILALITMRIIKLDNYIIVLCAFMFAVLTTFLYFYLQIYKYF